MSNSKDVCNDLDHLQQSYQAHISQCEAYGKIVDASKLDHTSSQHASDERGHDLNTAIVLSDDSVPTPPSPALATTILTSTSSQITTASAPRVERCQFPNAVVPPRASSQYSLLIGMLYTHPSQRHHKLQHFRDGVRCESMEKYEHQLVYTIDTGHAPNLAVAGRHIQHDFTTAGVLEKMDRL